MTPSLEGWPTKAKEAPSPHEVRLAPLDTNPLFQVLGSNFTSCPQVKLSPDFYHYPPGRQKLLIPPKQHFLKIFFLEQKERGEDNVVEKIKKISKGIGHKF